MISQQTILHNINLYILKTNYIKKNGEILVFEETLIKT